MQGIRSITVHNVNQALNEGLRHLEFFGIKQDSRVGPVLVSPVPVITTYENPTARVLFSHLRDANPYFHLMEALWMLAGRDDVKFLSYYNKRMGLFSDDGATLHGAYGRRWRTHFGLDQLELVIEELADNALSRRAVLAMWDPMADWRAKAQGGLDVPCNTHCYFDCIGGKLNMMVMCRSNDIWWGAYGANAVHFSILHEYIALAIGHPVGTLRQLSYNYHLYPDNLPEGRTLAELADNARHQDLYTTSIYSGEADRPHFGRTHWSPASPSMLPLLRTNEYVTDFDKDLKNFFVGDDTCDTIFFASVVWPMQLSWAAYKAKNYEEAERQATLIAAGDWQVACVEWLERRRHNRLGKEMKHAR